MDDFWGDPMEWMATDGMRTKPQDFSASASSHHDFESEKRRQHQDMLMRELEAAEDVARRVRQELHEMRKGLTPVVRDERRWTGGYDVDGTRDKYGRPWVYDVLKPTVDEDQTPLWENSKPTDTRRTTLGNAGRLSVTSLMWGGRESRAPSEQQIGGKTLLEPVWAILVNP